MAGLKKGLQALGDETEDCAQTQDSKLAIRACGALVERASSNQPFLRSAALYLRARAYHAAGQYEDSIHDTTEALGLNPKAELAAEFLKLRAQSYSEEGRANEAEAPRTAVTLYDAATASYEEASRLNPTDETVKKLGYLEAALAAVARSKATGKNDPKSAERFIAYGQASIRKGEYDRAIAEFSEAIRLDPKSVLAFSGRSLAYNGKDEYDRAIADASEAIRLDPSEAIQLDPKRAILFNTRALVYTRKGEYDRAIADLDETIRLDPKRATMFAARGNVYNLKGEYDRAIVEFNEAIRLDPKLPLAFTGRSNAFKGKGEYDRATADLNEAIRLDPNSTSP